ncbi:MAG: hypothetical protein IK016_11170 [Lachnospiraceae bacterium]|nr:hypothetical protein [Lachnospiraceae bacterium]
MGTTNTVEIKPVAPYKEVMLNGVKYKRPGVSPARMARAATVDSTNDLAEGAPGTPGNPIVKEGYEYVYSRSGRLIRLEHFDPETMERFDLTPDVHLTDEQREMLRVVDLRPVVYTADCPKSTPEQLQRMRRYGAIRNQKRRRQ